MYDLGQTTTNIMLAATDLGIGCGSRRVSDQEQARLVPGFPGGYFCAYRSVWATQPTATTARTTAVSGLSLSMGAFSSELPPLHGPRTYRQLIRHGSLRDPGDNGGTAQHR